MESTKFSLNKIDLRKIAVHLLVYGLGFGLIAVFKEITNYDFGAYNQIVGLIVGFLVDSIRKFVQGK